MKTLLTAHGQSRHGAHTVTVLDRTDSGDTGIVADLDEAPVLRYGETREGFTDYLLASTLELRLSGPGVAALIDEHFGVRFDPARYAVTITGPDGYGNTITWTGIPQQGEYEATAAPLVYPAGSVGLTAQCGLGRSREVAALPITGASLASLVYRLNRLNPLGTVLAGLTASAPGTPDGLISRLRTGSELAGLEPGDFGTENDVLITLAQVFGLVIYQPARGESGSTWHVCPRSEMGRARMVTRVLNPNQIDHQSLSAQAVELPEWNQEATIRRVQQIGSLTFESDSGGDLVYDGSFAYRDNNLTPIHWTPSAPLTNPDALPSGRTLTQSLVPLTQGDVFVRVTLEQVVQVYAYDPDPGNNQEVAYLAPADVALFIVPEGDFTNRYGPSWGTGRTRMGLGMPIRFDAPDSLIYLSTRSTTEPIPLPGRLHIQVRGGHGYKPDGEIGATAKVLSVRVELTDRQGLTIDNLVFRVGDGQGEAVKIDSSPLLERFDGSEWGRVERWQSMITPGDFLSVTELIAAERIAQQATNLRVFRGEVDGLIGPDTRLVFPSLAQDGASPFPEAVEMVMIGASLDFSTGRTFGVWVEAITDGGATEVLGKNERYTEEK